MPGDECHLIMGPFRKATLRGCYWKLSAFHRLQRIYKSLREVIGDPIRPSLTLLASEKSSFLSHMMSTSILLFLLYFVLFTPLLVAFLASITLQSTCPMK
ncbi:hypothetical protein CEXT_805231 [Caerostris extrusa]|uniref:Uncharacterized protein n=1 Tax=Caerostris extrusa TaxID=172846 RepID=A0AAV4XXX3_CAEEX|nr:hypothetical protein CEXT_805231 [Caerostris extrusa]